MSQIVCVHGIAQEYKSRESLLAEWIPALCGGVSNAGGRLHSGEIDMAFYGILFRPVKSGLATKGDHWVIPDYAPGDLTEPLAIKVLEDIFKDYLQKNVEAEPTKSGVARTVAGMLQVIARAPFFGSVSQKVVIWYLKQVSKYIEDPLIRAEARNAVLKTIHDDSRVLIGHSLGSVVAWETLCSHPELPIRTFITLGSPLGLPALLPRLDPSIMKKPGTWPEGIVRWINIADSRDLVALEKRLSNIFGSQVEDYLVENGGTMHNISPYLTSRELGISILESLK